ncbi:hypothetical protein H6G89_29230 [Oscillatoria sp. FACHB-1407]|uniref:hypothetical protein n=1 Tax=Oscillatoria sp. FACHB-1407 TaxID=2692847 RepID=UPI001686061D|nr:hypothetical protein [Oscillatoria sp. FACHB-1407]MBD2465093.1 hypothetical protein [Oscillatoria sp. FACHB-1407]
MVNGQSLMVNSQSLITNSREPQTSSASQLKVRVVRASCSRRERDAHTDNPKNEV